MAKKTRNMTLAEYIFWLLAGASIGIVLGGLATQWFAHALLNTKIAFWQAVAFNAVAGTAIILGINYARRK